MGRDTKAASAIPPAGPVAGWVAGVGVHEDLVRSIADSLADRGVELCTPSEATDRPVAGVVAFDQPTDELVRLLGELARERSGRVLALATTPVRRPDDEWRLLAAGAADVLTWSDDVAACQVYERLRRWHRVDELTRCRHVREHLVGTDPTWRAVLREAVAVAHFSDASVLLTGESGTGKEGVAQLVHALDPRPDKRELVVLDCSTVVPSLAGSEFFGHEKGAFTGAAGPREGAFELADGGTLFLDEVGELPGTLQSELLRVVQEGSFKRVGSNVWRTSRFRLVCATNRDLTAELARGTFREDFYYRIAACALHLPALRDRRADVLPLFEHFFEQVRPDGGAPALEGAVRRWVVERDYPGNVRDLRSLVQRIAQRHVGDGPITVGDVPEGERPASAAAAYAAAPPVGHLVGAQRHRG